MGRAEVQKRSIIRARILEVSDICPRAFSTFPALRLINSKTAAARLWEGEEGVAETGGSWWK